MAKQNIKIKKPRPARVVTIGGGSGQYALLSALRDLAGVEIAAIVSMADSGGSTGRLRDELGVLPPGDVLKCALALSKRRETYRALLLKRFTGGRLKGHNAGNLLLTFLAQYAGSFPAGLDGLLEILEARGRVVPVTLSDVTLAADLANGERITGESAIDLVKQKRPKIKQVRLLPNRDKRIKANPAAIKAIYEADFLILGPGDLFTSIIPNLLVPGLKKALREARGRLIYTLNIMTKYGETDGYTATAFVETIEKYAGRPVNLVLANNERPREPLLNRYRRENAEFVTAARTGRIGRRRAVKADLLNVRGNVIRHDAKKLAQALGKILGLKKRD